MIKRWLKMLTSPWIVHACLWMLVVVVIAFRVVVAGYEKPLSIDVGGDRFEVAKGSGLLQIAFQCEDRGWIGFPRFLAFYGRLFHYAGGLKAGEYRITPDMSLKNLLQKMLKGDVIIYQLTFVEGQTYRDYLQLLENTEGIVKTTTAGDESVLMKMMGENHKSPEGLLFPDTYFYQKGETDAEILKRAYHHLQEVLGREWAARAKDLPYQSPYDALIMASIIEKETAVEAERTKIAGVFVRRLQTGMRLQTDPTVIYGLGQDYTGNLTRQNLATPNPYNTYLNVGLPPTPIANPGEASIHAALNPEQGDALYFVATGEGRHHFSVTLDEHERAVDEFQRKRRADYRSAPVH